MAEIATIARPYAEAFDLRIDGEPWRLSQRLQPPLTGLLGIGLQVVPELLLLGVTGPAFLQLALHLGKDLVLDIGLHQTLAKDPDRVAIWNPAGVFQSGKALEAHAVQHLVLAVLVAEVVEVLEDQNAHHHLGGRHRRSVRHRPGCGGCAGRARSRCPDR